MDTNHARVINHPRTLPEEEITELCKRLADRNANAHIVANELNKAYPDYVFIAYHRTVILPSSKD